MTDYQTAWRSDSLERAMWQTDPGHEGDAYWAVGDGQAERLRPYLPATGTILDYGCGLGRTLRAIGRLGRFHLIGVDVSESHLMFAQAVTPEIEAVLTDGRSIPLPDEVVDLACSHECLQHMDAPDVASVLREIRRVLKPGGTAYLHFSTFGEPWTEDRRLWRGPGWEAMVAIAYSPEIVERLAREAGFEGPSVHGVPGTEDWDGTDYGSLPYLALVARKGARP